MRERKEGYLLLLLRLLRCFRSLQARLALHLLHISKALPGFHPFAHIDWENKKIFPMIAVGDFLKSLQSDDETLVFQGMLRVVTAFSCRADEVLNAT